MSTEQAARGKVLTEFAKNVDEGAGWWFRAPKDPNSSKGVTSDALRPDGIMPQLGSVFFWKNLPCCPCFFRWGAMK